MIWRIAIIFQANGGKTIFRCTLVRHQLDASFNVSVLYQDVNMTPTGPISQFDPN